MTTKRRYAILDLVTGIIPVENLPQVIEQLPAPLVEELATQDALATHEATPHGGQAGPHAADHASGGTDEITPAAIGAATPHAHPFEASGTVSTHAGTAHGLSSHAVDGAFHSGVEVLPTLGQKNALAGTTGTPGDLNRFVTHQDGRLSDARTPLTHNHDAAYSLLAHTHAGSGPTVVKLLTEQVSAVTAFANITGFTRAIAAGECVYFKALLGYRANAITTGIKLGVNGPASPAKLFYRTSTSRANALQSAAAATDNETTFVANTYDAPAADSGVAAVNVDYVATIEGVIFNGANAGTLAMRFASEVAVANGIILARGSHVMFWTI